MDKKNARWLLNRISNCQYVNLHLGEQENTGSQLAEEIVKEITGGNYVSDYFITVDIQALPAAKKESGNMFVNIINEQMAKVQFPHWFHGAGSIKEALEKLNQRLDKSAIVIFYYFQHADKDKKHKKDHEKEKSILIPIRRFMSMVDSIYLKILIISNQKTGKWDLAPFSDLDERFVEYIDYHKIWR
jgi:hypothetical protein